MPEEWVIWAYRLLLGREPENSAVIQSYCGQDFSPQKLCRALLESSEFRAQGFASGAELPEDAELRRLKAAFAVPAAEPRPGFFTDFLGVRTRCGYLPQDYARFSGVAEQPDGSGVVPLHEAAETVALLRSVQETSGPFTIAELGAGWGPWLVAGAAAARARGRPAHLIGVEGDETHFRYMQTHMRDNGIDPADKHILLKAVIGAKDGTAHFPVLPEPSADWGARASFDGAAATAGQAAARFVQLPSLSITTVLNGVDRVQHLHCDIQGEEAEALGTAGPTLDAKVLRVVVGTHGRGIEERLFALFAGLGWRLEYEKPCTFDQASSGMALKNDGVQVWRNDRLAGQG